MFPKKFVAIVAILTMYTLFCGHGGCGHLGAALIGGAIIVGTAAAINAANPPQPICYSYVYGEVRYDWHGRQYWHRYWRPRMVEVPCW